MAKKDHNLVKRKATYFKLQLDEKHCPVKGHFGASTYEGGIEPHRMRDLFRVVMFLGYGTPLDAPIEDEFESVYAPLEVERERVIVNIENGCADMLVQLSGSLSRVRGRVHSGKVAWDGPGCPDDWREELEMVEAGQDHPATRLGEALDELSEAVKVLAKELIADE